MRALVISDTHFGAWTGDDILREPETLALLATQLDVDEVIFLGDMFDFLFASLRDAFGAADGLLDLVRDKLQGKRFVFLAGNHDHHLVAREGDELLELELATGLSPDELRGELRRVDFFRRFLERRLEGVEVDVRYPTYTFSGVLCTHGHYLDFHARRTGEAARQSPLVDRGRRRGAHADDRRLRGDHHDAHRAALHDRPAAERHAVRPRHRSVREGGREPRLGARHRQDRLRPHASATRWSHDNRWRRPLLEHGLVDLRARSELKRRACRGICATPGPALRS